MANRRASKTREQLTEITVNITNTEFQSFEIAIGVIALIISLAFGAIPFVFSYRIVAFGAVLDLIMVALYGVAFGLMDRIYKDSYVERPKSNWVWKGSDDHQQIARDLNTFKGDSYVDITGLILFLASGIMGVILFCLGRRNAQGGFKV